MVAGKIQRLRLQNDSSQRGNIGCFIQKYGTLKRWRYIYIEVHKVYPAVGLTTVYRTLDLLVQMGLVSKFNFGEGRARYELSQGPKGVRHHHHLICTGCGRVINYTDFIDEEKEFLDTTEKSLSKKYNFKITNHLIQFYGLCDKCRGSRKGV